MNPITSCSRHQDIASEQLCCATILHYDFIVFFYPNLKTFKTVSKKIFMQQSLLHAIKPTFLKAD